MKKTTGIQQEDCSKQAVIIGAGPAGLTAAYEILQQTDIHPVIFESSREIGGISKTINYHGNRIDIGGHRFFSKSDQIMQWWQRIMHIYQADLPSGSEVPDKVMLVRQRVSRIFYLNRFFDYPISMKAGTFVNMGFKRTLKAGFGYLYSSVFKKKKLRWNIFISTASESHCIKCFLKIIRKKSGAYTPPN